MKKARVLVSVQITMEYEEPLTVEDFNQSGKLTRHARDSIEHNAVTIVAKTIWDKFPAGKRLRNLKYGMPQKAKLTVKSEPHDQLYVEKVEVEV